MITNIRKIIQKEESFHKNGLLHSQCMLKQPGLDAPNLIIYGGGSKIHEFSAKHNLVYIELVYIEQYMQETKKNG